MVGTETLRRHGRPKRANLVALRFVVMDNTDTAPLLLMQRDESERRGLFAAVVEAVEHAVVTKTLDGRITSWNHAAESMFGYSADEAVGQSIDIIVPPDRRGEVRDI